jgi:GNAT superfamily N-acetyltransferase
VEDVRVATIDDLPELVRILMDCVESTPSQRAGYLAGFPQRYTSAEERLQAACADPSKAVFVGLLENHPVGVALLVTVDGMPGGLLARVEELFVEPEARELGIGEGLLDACVGWAREHQCAGIEVEALPGARSAKNLAERSGFTARLIVLHRSLG